MKKLYKMIAVMMACVFAFSMCGCQSNDTPVGNEGELNIAILCNKETYDALNGVDAAVELAKKDAYDNYGITLNTEMYDDGGNYNTSIALAEQLAADDKIMAVVSVQEFEIVDSVASILNKAKKPFIIYAGCFDSIAEKDYDYAVCGFASAKKQGGIMGEYAIYKNLSKIAVIHTATEFETDEIKGFQSSISQSNVKICDMLVGPFTKDAFETAYSRWTALGIDGVYMSMYDLTLGGEIIRMLREKGSDIAVMTDYSIDNEASIAENGKYLDAVAYAPQFPIAESDKLNTFVKRCEELKGKDNYLSYAAQMYDLIMMLAHYTDNKPANSTEFMKLLKSEDGYDGVTGNIRFNQDGSLVVSNEQCRVFANGSFVLDTSFKPEVKSNE